MAQQKEQYSPQQRAMIWATSTRQYQQTLPTQVVTQEGMTLDFTLPKARLLTKIWLHVKAVATLKSSSGNIQRDPMSPYGILRRVELNLNNGFSPYIVSGKELFMYNVLRQHPDVLLPGSNKQSLNYVENVATTAGKDNEIQFTVPIPVSLNDRDPVGMVMLQNNTANVNLTVAVDQLANAYKLNASNADQVTFKSMSITPVIETFSIPSIPGGQPDMSVLKLVQSNSDLFSGGGQNILKLNVGTIYRKLLFYIEDSNGKPLEPKDFTGNMELVFNQADTPYNIKPEVLVHKNHSDLGYPLPPGVYCFDFSNQGVPNLGGSRDYIDSERLTEFWFRFSTQVGGKVTVVSETLSRLQM
ncbi:cytoplasmic protein [Bacillus paranthracis]|uniref:cytoplasmic protein n=1 Tax=Bacillus paranthracis TaxID=2026186 RepID=UPI0021D27726|nr:cytoplasmic protein [Bacillus paranthracis]MCU5568097.1 cytoplasmic protein [Bacillus paranthracis]